MHHAELSALTIDVHYNCSTSSSANDMCTQQRTLLEVTSSGLTHHCGRGAINGILCLLMLDMFHTHRYPTPQSYYIGRNYGNIQLIQDGFATTPALNISIQSLQSEVPFVPLSLIVQSGAKVASCNPAWSYSHVTYTFAPFYSLPQEHAINLLLTLLILAACVGHLAYRALRRPRKKSTNEVKPHSD